MVYSLMGEILNLLPYNMSTIEFKFWNVKKSINNFTIFNILQIKSSQFIFEKLFFENDWLVNSLLKWVKIDFILNGICSH